MITARYPPHTPPLASRHADLGTSNLAVVGAVFAGELVGTLFRHGLGVMDTRCEPGNLAELGATYSAEPPDHHTPPVEDP